jgi:hypothetical protein
LDGYVEHERFSPSLVLIGGAEERDFAAAWWSKPKWVVSRSLKAVGPNAMTDSEVAKFE